MSEFKKERFSVRKHGRSSGASSFYGLYRHTGMEMGPFELPFPAPMNDSYASHISFSDIVKPTGSSKSKK